MQAALFSLVFGYCLMGGLDPLMALAPLGTEAHAQSVQTAMLVAPLVWAIDTNGDGSDDLVNPTHSTIRGTDLWGSGNFGASRDGGRRVHHGTDYVATAGDPVRAPFAGTVTRIGYAYRNERTLRFVQVRNPATSQTAMLLYVSPVVAEGDTVSAGETLGFAQSLAERYPFITNHVHVELRDEQGRLLNASAVLPDGRPVLGGTLIQAATNLDPAS